MHEVIVRFDRVFDVVRIEAGGGNQRHTVFGFQNSNMRQCGVKVSGWPDVTPNTSYAIVLKRQEDWQSILGWVNLSTGEVAKGHASATAVIVLIALAVSLLLLLKSVSTWPIVVFLLFVSGVAVSQLRNELATSLVLKRLGKTHQYEKSV